MRALVFVFDGAEPPQTMLQDIVATFKVRGYDGKIHISSLDGTEVARAIVESQRPHFIATEEGDNAVIAFRTLVPYQPNTLDFILKTHEYLCAGDRGASKETEAFLRAASLISQEVPVSKRVADEYHYTDAVRKKIKEIYNKFKSN